MAEVMRATAWTNNSHMIEDVARLGYLDGLVLDATYGEGAFWNLWRPETLVTSDLYKPAKYSWDYKNIPMPDSHFDVVVFDPPYKLSGTPSSPKMDHAYGVEEYMPREERLEDIRLGALECFRVAGKFLLVKCMDQVEGGKMRWQTDIVTRAVEEAGGRKVDRFDYLHTPRPQPEGRRQKTARSNYSTLLVFAK